MTTPNSQSEERERENPTRSRISQYTTRLCVGTHDLYGKLLVAVMFWFTGSIIYDATSIYWAHNPGPGRFSLPIQLIVSVLYIGSLLVVLSYHGKDIQQKRHNQLLAKAQSLGVNVDD